MSTLPSSHDLDNELAEFGNLISALRKVDRPAPRPDFVASLREQLMAEAPAAEVAPVRSIGLGSRRRRMSAAIAGAAMVVSATGVAAAAQTAGPGSPLYPIKRGVESIQLMLTMDQAGRGQEELSTALSRLNELSNVVQSGGPTSQAKSALADFTHSANGGSSDLFASYASNGSASAIDQIRTFTNEASKKLASINATAPSADTAGILSASALVADIDQHARAVCAACSTAAAVPPVTLPGTPSSTPVLNTVVSAPAPSAPAAPKVTSVVPKVTSTVPTTTTVVPTASPSPTQPVTGVVSGVPSTVGGVTSTTTGLLNGVTGTVGGLIGGLTGGL